MNPFQDLMPAPVSPPPLPYRGGPAAAVAAAALRRRARRMKAVTAASVTALAFGGIVLLRPPAALHGVDVRPDAPSPTATTRPVPATHAPDVPGDGLPGGPGTGPGGHVPPAPGTGAGTPAPTQHPSTPPSSPPAGPQPHGRVTRSFVPDPAPGQGCTTETSTSNPGVILCTRTIGPGTIASGQGTTFTFQACGFNGSEATIQFTSEVELRVGMHRGNEDTASDEVWTPDPMGHGTGAHTIVIPAGHCLQYEIPWDGRDDARAPLDPGEYILISWFGSGEGWGPWEISAAEFVIT
jgi:hypothetical protein